MSSVKDGLFRAGQWFVYWLLWAGMVWAALAQGSGVTTTTVQGTVYLANGQPASGTVQFSWPSFTTASGQAIAAGRTSIVLPADGFLSINLAPNQGSNPAGLFYTVTYNLSDGSAHNEYWTVPAAAQATIGSVRAQVMPAAQAVQTVSKSYVDQAIQQALGSDLSINGGNLTGPLYLSSDPTTPLQAADKHYVDESFSNAIPLAGGAATGPLTATRLGAAWQVDQFPGADFAAKLQACINNLSATYGGICDARNFSGQLAMGSSVTISTADAAIELPCATIATANQIIVTAGTRNVTLQGCATRGSNVSSGATGGTVFLYSGTASMIQVGDPAYAVDTQGFRIDSAVINITASTASTAQAIVAYRTQELGLSHLYVLGNSNQTGITLDGTGNYTGGSLEDNQITGFLIGINAIGHQVSNAATTDWTNATTFLRQHIDCPTNSGTPISGSIGLNLVQGDGNTFIGGDVESCSVMLHLGLNAQNNTIVGVRNENSTNQVVADSGSKYNSWITGGTMYTGQLTDNGSHNSFWDSFHRGFNNLNGDIWRSQSDSTVTDHYYLGIGLGNERGRLKEIGTDYGFRWEEGYSDAMGTGFQTWSVEDLLNNVPRFSVGQYLASTPNIVTNIVLSNGGCYISSTPPTVTISGGGGSGATAIASMSANSSLSCNGGSGYQVATVLVTSNGSGYTAVPTVTYAGSNQAAAPNSVAEIVTQGSTNNQTVVNAAGTGAVVLNGSNNSGTGGVVFGSGGATSTGVGSVSNTGNASFNGTLTVGSTSQHAGTLTVRNNADTEVDYYLWPGLTASQKGSFTYKDYNGASQWYMVKDASNNWALNSATGGLDAIKAYQSVNSGDLYLDTANSSGHIRLNYESGAGAETDIYSGGSSNLDAAFLSPTAIKLPGLAATSGKYCLQIDNSGYITNTGTACGSGTGSGGSGTVNTGTSGQVAVYSTNGNVLAGLTSLPLTAGGTGSTTAAGALSAIGAQAAMSGVASDGNNGLTITGNVKASVVNSTTSVSSANGIINIMAAPYGAACNLHQYSNGSISVNSNTLTGSGFSSTLVGQKVILWGAGTNNGTTGSPNYGPLIATVSAFVSSTQLTLSATASATVPNSSNNPNGNFEIGTDDTTAIQNAYNAAVTADAAVLIPANNGLSCLTGAIDLSAGGTHGGNIPPIAGQGSSVSALTGEPGQDVLQWPDGRSFSYGFGYVKGLTINLDTSLDVSCPSGTGCASTGNGRTAANRVTGMQAASQTTITSFNGSGGSLTITTPVGTTPYTAGGLATFNGCTGALASLNWTGANSYPVIAAPAPTATTFSIASSISGSGTDTCSVTGLTPVTPAISPGPVSVTNATFSLDSSTGNYDFVNAVGQFQGIPSWEVLGQPVSITVHGTPITSTILQINSNSQVKLSPTTFCAASLCGPQTASAWSSTGSTLTLTVNNSYQANDDVVISAGSSDALYTLNGLAFAVLSATSTSVTISSTPVASVTVSNPFIAPGSGLTGATTTLALNGTWGTGIAPPWYVGNAAIAIPASNGNYAGNVLVNYEDLSINAIPSAVPYANHSTAFFFQQPPISQFKDIKVSNTYYCYTEALNITNNQITWTPDTSGYRNFNCSSQIKPIMYAGNHRVIEGMNLYSANHPLSIGPFMLNGPLNNAGNSTVAHFYLEPWFNSGEQERWQGTEWTIDGGSLLQGPGQVVWQANQSVINNAQIFGVFGSSTPALSILGNTNVFNSLYLGEPGANGTYASQVSDQGVGNYVSISQSNMPVVVNKAHCVPGMADYGFLSGYSGMSFPSRCSLVFDAQTIAPNSVSASYVAATPGDGNPAPGYLNWSASVTSGFVLLTNSYAMTVGTIVPVGTMNVVTGGYVGTAGTLAMQVYDVTANMVLTTCGYSMTSMTYALHGQAGSADVCTLTTNSSQIGHVLEIVSHTSQASLNGVWLAFTALVPQSTDPENLPNGSTATTQATIDASGSIATDAFVHNAIAAQTGYQLSEYTNGGVLGSNITITANTIRLFSFSPQGSITATKVSFTPGAADPSSSDSYDLGIYNASGSLLCHLGPTQGPTFAPGTGTITLPFLSACNLTGGQRYYLGITGNAATAQIAGTGKILLAQPGGTPGGASAITTGGALNSTVTPPIDAWSSFNGAPQFSLHN